MTSQPDSAKDNERAVKVSMASLHGAFWVLKYLKPYRVRVGIALVAQFCSTTLGLAFPYASGALLDAALGRDNESGINAIALTLIGVLAGQACCSFVSVINFLTAVERAVADLRRDSYARLIRLPMAFFATRRVGELAGRISADLTKVEDTLGETFPHFLRQSILLFGGIALIAITSLRLAAFMLVTIPPLVIVAIFFGKRLRDLAKATQDRLADANVIVEETLQGVATVKAFGNEPHEIQRYRVGMDELVKMALKGAWSYAGFVAFIVFALFGGLVLVLWSGAQMVAAGTLSPGELASFLLYTLFVAGAMGSYAEVFGQLQQALGATERVREILDEVPEDLPAESPIAIPARSGGRVQFQDVRFRYPSRPEATVLDGLTLEAAPSQKIALVGPSGAGKSTAVAILLRFYDPESGSVTLDGRDVRTLPLASLRARIAVVPQDVMLFGGSIAENIEYGRPGATLAEVESAARQAFAHDFITSFPDGYATKVGERGVQLSGGQRQRIAIARAILRNPSVLVLDEATSSLDAESEHLVQKALDALLAGRTAIIIAHRLATVRRADRIFVIDRGRVVESGTHAELIDAGGLYHSLARLQFVDGTLQEEADPVTE